MMPAATNGGGQIATTGPSDVCKVPGSPPVPTPFPNLGSLTQTKGSTCSSKVKMINKKPLDATSELSMSSGDEAGTVGGVKSGKFKGPCRMKSGSSKVRVEGKKLAHQNSDTGHNGSSANVPVGKLVTPGQTKIKVQP
jgi:hypothetical protein